jgi:tetratricopeptide (TPR) repeat protein
VIVSTTLAGPGSEGIIGDALASVAPVVDRCIVIDTRPSPVKVPFLDVPRDTYICYYTWTGSFSDARNFALGVAASIGAEWALTIDADERLVPAGPNDRLSKPNISYADVELCYDEARTYAKERWIRLPLKPGAGWVGPTHECFLAGKGARIITNPHMRVRELPKTPEQLLRKFQRDRDVLEKYCMEHKDDSRWWFYLAETYRNLGDTKMASETYSLCAQKSNWDEEKAWSLYCVAKIEALEGQYRSALGYCVYTLLAHPGFAEAAALAAWCESKRGHHKATVYWCKISQTIDEAEKGYSGLTRIGFRDASVLGWVYNLAQYAWDHLNATP